MSMSVCKFGGSSLSDAGMFRRVINIVRGDHARRYIVLSAPGKRFGNDRKITDLLYAACDCEIDDAQYIFSQIRERYVQIRDVLCPGFDIEQEIEQTFQNIGISRDYAASRGEYLCAKLFAACSGIDFVDAADIIRFYDDGTLDMQSTRERVKSRLSCLDRAVLPGFYGSLPDGTIKTFTRGGSDVSGAIIAAALDADLYENWTDVDGLFTADPNLVTNARRNPLVSLDQMESIAKAGANLLHADSLSVLRGTGIDTVIKNTFSPKSEGTRISESCTACVKCVTGKRNLTAPLLKSLTGSACAIDESRSPYCAISIFGLDSTAMRGIHAVLRHICIIHMRDHYILITQNDQYETAIRIIHDFMK